jgi:hypothetical protein
MSINWKEIGWWLMAVVCIAHVYGSAYNIVTYHNARPAITQQ